MDPSKKRKPDENGTAYTTPLVADPPSQALTLDDARKLINPFTHDQLLSILQSALIRHPDVLSDVRSLADSDVTRRKLFVRGLGPDTTTESLKSVFSAFGELNEAVVVADKNTGKSKGYGFVTFKHVDCALVALKEPSKRIDGRMTVTQLASAGQQSGGDDVALRKIYVGNVPFEIPAERLLDYFAGFGEIEEGPLGFDRQGGKPRGFAFFVYKTEEGARASLVEPLKKIDGYEVSCKLAVDGKKGKGGNAPNVTGVAGGERVGAMGMGANVMGGSVNPQFGGSTGLGTYGGYSGGFNQGLPMGSGPQGPLSSSVPSSMGGHGPGGIGSAASGYSSGLGGGYSGGLGGGYSGGLAGSYGGGSQFSVPGSGEFGSYRMPPPNSMGMPTGGYPESGFYGSGSAGYGTQNHPPSQPPQVPPSGAYQRMPPYY